MRALSISFVLVAAMVGTFAHAAEPIGWEETDRHVGEEATVEGRVMGVHCSPLSCLLAFDPSFNRFTAVIQARNFGTFPPDQLDRLYSGKRVLVHGTIRKIDGKPEIEVDRPDDLRVETGKRRGERDDTQTARTQAEAELFERLGEVLDRVTDLTERLAAVQERMETLLAQLEQRAATLATAQSAQAPAPPPPSYGEPQPRPGFEALRSIKRGMSRADVQRLVGQPLYVESATGGWDTWYYGYGRSVSFNNRGRVQSLSGFPKP